MSAETMSREEVAIFQPAFSETARADDWSVVERSHETQSLTCRISRGASRGPRGGIERQGEAIQFIDLTRLAAR